MTSPDTLAQTIREALDYLHGYAADTSPPIENDGQHADGLIALDSLLDMAREAATLREIAEKFVSAYPGNTVAQLGNGAARRAHGEFAAALAAAAPAETAR